MSLVSPSGAAGTTGPERRTKRGIRGFLQKYFTSYPESPASSAPASRASPASSLRPSTRRARDRSTPRAASGSASNSPSASRPVTPLRSHHPPSGVTVADRPITQPRPERSHRRRRRRRTQSPVGLPIYSEQPTENEMSLFKSHDDAFPTRTDVDIEEEEDDYEDESDDDEDGLEEIDGEQSEDDEAGAHDAAREEDEEVDGFFAMPPRRSFDVSATDVAGRRRSATHLLGVGADVAGRPPIRGRPRAASEPLGHQLTPQTTRSSLARSTASYNSNSPYLHGSSSPFASRSGLIELPPRPPSPPASAAADLPASSSSSRGFSFCPSYFTHRSSRSSPVIAPNLSSTPPLLPNSASTGSLGGGRPRASTLQKLMSSSAGTSNTSLAPPVGFDPALSGGGASPYGSLGTRASASQVSVGGRSISAPLANSFVHSSFVFPKTGPTPEQVAFISSRQAIGAYGYGAGASPPPPLNLSLSTDENELAPPPPLLAASTTTSDREGLVAPIPIRGRGRSGSEASQMSAGGSPLARTVQLVEPAASSRMGFGIDTAMANRLELDQAAEPDSPPPPLTPPPTLPPLPTLDSITAGLSFSLEEGSAVPSALVAAAEVSSLRSHRPPAITTSAPTPTASAAPSPALSSRASFAAP
ncbi:hypothetical protein JCM10908_002057 [Rhodotorula pacifica]|uniref:uncharacterized protein n=1 Tax=Rhodotorula pacifica TaxID=1495444 RepID=UPI0031795E8A